MDEWGLFEIILSSVETSYVSEYYVFKDIVVKGEQKLLYFQSTFQLVTMYTVIGDFSDKSVRVLFDDSEVGGVKMTLSNIIGYAYRINRGEFELLNNPAYIGCSLSVLYNSYFFKKLDRIYKLTINYNSLAESSYTEDNDGYISCEFEDLVKAINSNHTKSAHS